MKLKYIDINRYGILVDESAEIKEGDLCFNAFMGCLTARVSALKPSLQNHEYPSYKIMFAEKELNLNVPQLNWREWEVEQLAIKNANDNFESGNSQWVNGFIAGYNHSKAKYTEENLKFIFECGRNFQLTGENNFKESIQSLQKLPTHIVMESEEDGDCEFGGREFINYSPKLITNSESKQEGIIKEIIY